MVSETSSTKKQANWRASRNTKPSISILDKHVSVKGNIVSQINACTTIATPKSKTKRPDVCQTPSSKKPAYTTDEYVKEAIYFCFRLAFWPQAIGFTATSASAKESFWKLFGYFLSKRSSSKDYEKGFLGWLDCPHNWDLHLEGSFTLGEVFGHKHPRPRHSAPESDMHLIQHAWKTLQLGYRLCVLKSGLIGWAAANVRVGDIIAILHGCSVPVVLRNMCTEGSSSYTIVGDSLIHDLMQGRGLTEESRDIILA